MNALKMCICIWLSSICLAQTPVSIPVTMSDGSIQQYSLGPGFGFYNQELHVPLQFYTNTPLVTYVSPTVLNFGTYCYTSSPCNINVLGIVSGMIGGTIVTLKDTIAGVVNFSIGSPNPTSSSGVSPVWQITSTVNVTCTGNCIVFQGTGWPQNSIPIWQWTAAAASATVPNSTWMPSGVRWTSFLYSCGAPLVSLVK